MNYPIFKNFKCRCGNEFRKQIVADAYGVECPKCRNIVAVQINVIRSVV
jgi:hypothetical protein